MLNLAIEQDNERDEKEDGTIDRIAYLENKILDLIGRATFTAEEVKELQDAEEEYEALSRWVRDDYKQSLGHA